MLYDLSEFILIGALSTFARVSPNVLNLSIRLNYFSAASISIFTLDKNDNSISTGLDLYSLI